MLFGKLAYALHGKLGCSQCAVPDPCCSHSVPGIMALHNVKTISSWSGTSS